jgi:hypothetical protein
MDTKEDLQIWKERNGPRALMDEDWHGWNEWYQKIIQHRLVIRLPRFNALKQIMNGRSAIKFYGLPEDIEVLDVWVERTTLTVMVVVIHPEFPAVPEGGIPPELALDYKFHTSLTIDEKRRWNIPQDELVFNVGYADTERGNAIKQLLESVSYDITKLSEEQLKELR